MIATSGGGAAISLVRLTKRFHHHLAVDDVSLEVEPGEFITLLGPSGSGKTTTLNLLAGFARQDSGHVRIDSREVDSVPPHRRDLGIVFQNYALFPHMSAAENVAFGLRQRRVPRAQRAELVAAAFETVRLSGMENRRPTELSGGQQQRVALARAIAFDPRVLLMDEPLGALDRALREEMQFEIRRIHRSVGSTVVFVTHDQEEALALSDRIAVFDRGRLHQVGTADDLYERPQTPFVARFIGESTIVDGVGGQVAAGTCSVRTAGGEVRVRGTLSSEQSVSVMVRPERLVLSSIDADPQPGGNHIVVDVLDCVYLGSSRKVVVRLPDGSAGLVRETSGRTSDFRAGDRARLDWQVQDGVLLVEPGVAAAPTSNAHGGEEQ
ncbi:ABC transporter ATP-binding protein [Nocardioides sp.]|uniref:ABC transporter ATP-binding protein n=1 Tax=Nocardioides sp. TaxID=35761 RepID=UPI0037847EDA